MYQVFGTEMWGKWEMGNGQLNNGQGGPIFHGVDRYKICGHKIRPQGNGKWARLTQFPIIARTRTEIRPFC